MSTHCAPVPLRRTFSKRLKVGHQEYERGAERHLAARGYGAIDIPPKAWSGPLGSARHRLASPGCRKRPLQTPPASGAAGTRRPGLAKIRLDKVGGKSLVSSCWQRILAPSGATMRRTQARRCFSSVAGETAERERGSESARPKREPRQKAGLSHRANGFLRRSQAQRAELFHQANGFLRRSQAPRAELKEPSSKSQAQRAELIHQANGFLRRSQAQRAELKEPSSKSRANSSG